MAKTLTPPGSYIWNDNTAGMWLGILSKRWRIHRAKWSLYSENGALKVVLRGVWQDWAEYAGLKHVAVPIKGLLEKESTRLLSSASEAD